MKGVVFKTFEAFVEERFGDDLIDAALQIDGLSSGGAFTTIGNYPHSDLVSIVVFISERTGLPVSQLVREFGASLFHVLAGAHGVIMPKFSSCVDMLAGIEAVIHRDVRKLYSHTELPQFDVESRDGDRSVRIVYRSGRGFADLAEGLILGAFEHYGVKTLASLTRYDLASDGTHAAFEIVIDHDAAPGLAG